MFALPNLAFGESVQSILQKVDNFRSPYANAKLDITVVSKKDGKVDKTSHYTVYTKNSDNLVVMKNGPSKGNRVLLIEKGMYLATKGSSRPVRITPMQRLMGQASYGDLASMRMADSYDGKISSKENGEILLELTATKKASTYRKLKLWVDENYKPLRMDASLASDKLFKKMKYNVKGKKITSIEYFEPKITNKSTIIYFKSVENKKLHRRYFTPKGMKNEIK